MEVLEVLEQSPGSDRTYSTCTAVCRWKVPEAQAGTKKKKIKGWQIWAINLSCIAQILGFFISTVMLAKLTRGHGTCTNTFFTTYNVTVGCKVSPVGHTIIGIHYAFEILFLIILAGLFLHHGLKHNLVCIFCDYDDRNNYYFCKNRKYTLLSMLFFPLFLLHLLFSSLILMFLPHLLIRNSLHFRSFHLLSMGKQETDRYFYKENFSPNRLDTHSRGCLLFCQTVQACTLVFENFLELFITLILFVAGYFNIVSILFAVPACINTAVRLLLLPVLIFDLIKQHCVETVQALSEDIEIEEVRAKH